jgi:hypothetical protein
MKKGITMKMKYYAFCVLLLMLFVASAVFSQENGEEAIEQGNIYDARTLLEDAAKESPKEGTARKAVADYYSIQRGLFGLAAGKYDEALKLVSEDPIYKDMYKETLYRQITRHYQGDGFVLAWLNGSLSHFELWRREGQAADTAGLSSEVKNQPNLFQTKADKRENIRTQFVTDYSNQTRLRLNDLSQFFSSLGVSFRYARTRVDNVFVNEWQLGSWHDLEVTAFDWQIFGDIDGIIFGEKVGDTSWRFGYRRNYYTTLWDNGDRTKEKWDTWYGEVSFGQFWYWGENWAGINALKLIPSFYGESFRIRSPNDEGYILAPSLRLLLLSKLDYDRCMPPRPVEFDFNYARESRSYDNVELLQDRFGFVVVVPALLARLGGDPLNVAFCKNLEFQWANVLKQTFTKGAGEVNNSILRNELTLTYRFIDENGGYVEKTKDEEGNVVSAKYIDPLYSTSQSKKDGGGGVVHCAIFAQGAWDVPVHGESSYENYSYKIGFSCRLARFWAENLSVILPITISISYGNVIYNDLDRSLKDIFSITVSL